MAKPAQELQKLPIPYIYPDTKACQCGLSLTEEEYESIESSVTGKRYDDIVDMVKQQNCRWSEDFKFVIDEFGEIRSEKEYREVMGVS